MDSIEVAARFTEAIMAQSRPKGANPAESYVDMFAEVLKRINVVMDPIPAEPPPPLSSRATSDVFPLTHKRRD